MECTSSSIKYYIFKVICQVLMKYQILQRLKNAIIKVCYRTYLHRYVIYVFDVEKSHGYLIQTTLNLHAYRDVILCFWSSYNFPFLACFNIAWSGAFFTYLVRISHVLSEFLTLMFFWCKCLVRSFIDRCTFSWKIV